MAIETVGLLSPGDMGHAVGRVLGDHGIDVVTCLDGRSERTRVLAASAGIRDAPSVEEMVASSDLVLSILVPAEAVGVCKRVAQAVRASGIDTPFADCNATSPQTARTMEAIMLDAGGRYIDGSIIGGPPSAVQAPRFYVSGAHAGIMAELDGKGIDVRPLGDAVGRASGIKMCYASVTKGTSALLIAQLAVAEALELSEELAAELRSSQPDSYGRMEAQIPSLPSKAFRWIGEMEEIAATFAAVGVTPGFHQGAAEIYRLLSETPFADEAPEEIDQRRTLEQTISAIAALLQAPAEAEPPSALRQGDRTGLE